MPIGRQAVCGPMTDFNLRNLVRNPLKPKNVADITKGGSVFNDLPHTVNLYQSKLVLVRVKQPIKVAVALFSLFGFLLSSAIFPSLSAIAPTTPTFAAQTDDERKALETQLGELEKQIDEYESTITTYKQQGKSLKGEIDRLNAKVAQLSLQIRAINISIVQLDNNISTTKKEIQKTESEIDVHKSAISNLLKNIYESDSESIVEVLLTNPTLSDFFGNLNDTFVVKDSLRDSLQSIVDLRTNLLDQRERLSLEREDAAALKTYQDTQKLVIQKTKTDKDTLLVATKGQESKYQALLIETKKTAAQIRSQIFKLLGGGELTFETAYEFAKQAEGATGVRAAFILSILNRESALGQNVGRCNYKDAMAPGPPKSKRNDVAPFLQITSELGLNPDTLLVSCANADGAYGGAMGPAQFIPTTWMLYRARVAQITGSNPANPWSNADAFVAAGLYLKDAGATAVANEQVAAAKYYCGSNWNRYTCLNVYGARVAEGARRFQDDIDVLNS